MPLDVDLCGVWQLPLKRGGRILEVRSNPMPDGGIVVTYTDITGRVEADEALKRAKESLEQRVAARTAELTNVNRELARAQALLASNHLKQAPMADLALAVLEPLCQEEHRNRISIVGGAPLQLSPHGAFIVTLMLGELGANAMKHGALADDAGAVTLSWREEGSQVIIEWRETTSGRSASEQAAVDSSGPGFGSRILRQIVPLDLKGKAEWSLTESGFSYTLSADSARLLVSEDAPDQAFAQGG